MTELEILIEEIKMIENKYLDRKEVLKRLVDIRKELCSN